MNRHAVDVARGALRLHNSRTASFILVPLLRARISTTALLRQQRFPHRHSAPLHTHSVLTRRGNASTKDMSFRWPRSATPELTNLALHRFRASETLTRGTARWILHKRWYSDGRFSPERRAGDGQNQAKPSSGTQPQHDQLNTTISGSKEAHRSLYDRLPHLPHLHRPTKEELLAAATGFWHRVQIRFKWFSIRSVRPFNHEEIFAFLSWIFWGHVLWFVIGTTTFVSLMILAANTVFAQETLAGWVGNYLTRSSGLRVVFESAIVPRWGDGVITFNKVFVSRRPATKKRERSVTKGSSEIAAAAAAAEAQAEKEKHVGRQAVDTVEEQEDDGNYTQFDITVEKVEVSLSFTKWFNGKGLLRDVSIDGVKGVLDRTHVKPRVGNEDPKSYRHEHNTGDFEIDNFKMHDVTLTVYQPNNFRPFQVQVYDCELPRLRKQWLFYDFMCANNAHGSFDNSLFTVHHRQVHGATGVTLAEGREEEASQWKKHSRLRVDGLKIDHLNRGVEGPFSWIYEGNVEIVADIMIPHDADGSIAKVMSDFYDRVEATVTQQASNGRSHSRDVIDNKAMHADSHQEQSQQQQQPAEPPREEDNRFIVFDIQIHLNDVRASVPIFTRDLSYVNNAVVRPIVAYINSHAHGNRNYIPISCRIVKTLSEFDGSWTVFDSGLLDDLSRETYDAFVRDITDRKARQRRIKKVGLWAAQVAAHALFVGLAGQLA